MTTAAELLSDIRLELQDTGATPRWSDELLFLFLCDGVRDYSRSLPRKVSRKLVRAEDDGVTFDLPEDFLEEIAVESPLDTYLTKREAMPGKTYAGGSDPFYFYLDGSSLRLDAEAETIYLTYHAYHSLPETYTDDDEISVPDGDLDLIRLYVRSRVHGQMMEKTARLDRFDPSSSRRDDNPLIPPVNMLDKVYRSRLAERSSVPGVIRLFRM